MLENAFIISLIVLFLHACSWDDQIFSGIKKVIKPEWKISKPIYGCPICMGVWWGTAMYFIFYGRSGVIDWIATIFTVSGFGVIYVILLSIREACVNYNKKFEK